MSESADPSNASRYFKLGVFMLSGIVLLVASIIVLGAGALFSKTVASETLVYQSVNGLDVGAAVKYRGVLIGKVTEILFATTKYPNADKNQTKGKDIRGILIEMAINERTFPHETSQQITDSANELVGRGLRAQVTQAGISGQSYIDFDILDPVDHPPPPISWKPDVLYVPSAPSSIGQVLDAAGQIATDLKKANLGKVVGHIDDLVTQATTAAAEIRQLVANNKENLNRTLVQLPDTAERLKTTVARADQILHDSRIDKALTGLSGASDSANSAMADIRRLVREASELLAGESDDLRSIVADFRRLAADGAAMTDDLRQNPSRLLFGKPPEPGQGSAVAAPAQ